MTTAGGWGERGPQGSGWMSWSQGVWTVHIWGWIVYFAGLVCYPGAFGSVLDGGTHIRINGWRWGQKQWVTDKSESPCWVSSAAGGAVEPLYGSTLCCVNDEQESSSVLNCLKPTTCSTTWQLEEKWWCGCFVSAPAAPRLDLCAAQFWGIVTEWFEQFVDRAVLGQSISARHVGHFVCILTTLARKHPQRPHKHQDWNME